MPPEEPRLEPADVRRDEMDEAARDQKTPDRGERRDRIGEVFDGVVERDHVEGRLRQVELLEPARRDAKPALARPLRGERGDLHTFDVPAGGLRLEEEVTERAADVQEPSAAAVATFDRGDAIPKGAAVHVRVEEIVRVAALGVVGRVVVRVIQE